MKHQNYDAIVAWAEGKDIQFKCKDYANNCWMDWNTLVVNDRVSGVPDFSNNNLVWRVKPESSNIQYRVALIFNTQDKSFFTKTLDKSVATEKDFANTWDTGYMRFVRWLTDWVDVDTSR